MVDAAATCSSNQSDLGVLDTKHKLVMMSSPVLSLFLHSYIRYLGVGACSWLGLPAGGDYKIRV